MYCDRESRKLPCTEEDTAHVDRKYLAPCLAVCFVSYHACCPSLHTTPQQSRGLVQGGRDTRHTRASGVPHGLHGLRRGADVCCSQKNGKTQRRWCSHPRPGVVARPTAVLSPYPRKLGVRP